MSRARCVGHFVLRRFAVTPQARSDTAHRPRSPSRCFRRRSRFKSRHRGLGARCRPIDSRHRPRASCCPSCPLAHVRPSTRSRRRRYRRAFARAPPSTSMDASPSQIRCLTTRSCRRSSSSRTRSRCGPGCPSRTRLARFRRRRRSRYRRISSSRHAAPSRSTCRILICTSRASPRRRSPIRSISSDRRSATRGIGGCAATRTRCPGGRGGGRGGGDSSSRRPSSIASRPSGLRSCRRCT